MREIEKIVTYELSPQELKGVSLEDKMIDEARYGWTAVQIPRKHQMQFDANHNKYYAKVHYERTP